MKVPSEESIPPFAIVPSHAIRDPELLDSDLRVYSALCAFRNTKSGRLDPSQALIGLAARCTPVTVRAALKRLRKRGYIDWEPRFWPNGGWCKSRLKTTAPPA